MELHEIENLSAAELKERREELVAAARKAPVDQLAARYVQARTDAKLREDKLAEQGKTIMLLQQAMEKSDVGHELTKQSLVQTQAALSAKEKELGASQSIITARDSERTQLIDDFQQKLAAETARANAADAFAKARRKGLADVAAIINPLLAAE